MDFGIGLDSSHDRGYASLYEVIPNVFRAGEKVMYVL